MNLQQKCETCGNDYAHAFQIVMEGKEYTFDSFECAIRKLAPKCTHCGTQVIGHGVEENDLIFCCSHCAQATASHKIRDLVD